MPTPRTNESRDDFIARCIPIVLDEGTAEDNDQAVAVCNSMWEEREVKEMNELRDYFVAEFRGNFPQINNDPRVDVGALTAGDDAPFYVTLPVARVGEASANGLLYDEELVEAIESQMVGKGGIMGHIKPDERDTSFPIEDADWVGARRDGSTLWGKAYIPPGEAREYIRRLMARGGKLATSIYGRGNREAVRDGVHRMRGFLLESLDLAPADRAALKLGGQFAVTAQMETETEEGEPAMDKKQLLAELTAGDVPATIREQLIADWQADNADASRIAELEQQVEDRDTVISDLRDQLEQVRVREFDNALDGVVAEYVKLEANSDEGKKRVEALQRMFRARLIAELGDERDEDKLQTVAETVWKDEMKVIAETVRDALAGPPARVSGKVRGRTELDDTPEARRRARAAAGF